MNRLNAAERCGTGFAAVIAAVSTAAFVIPLAAALLQSGSSDSGAPVSAALRTVTARTFFIAACSTLAAAAAGIPAAFFIARRNFLLRPLLMSLSAVPLCVPALIIALGFVSTFGMNGFVNRVLMKLFAVQKPPITFLYSTAGIIIAQGFYNFPLVAAVTANRWMHLPHEQEDGARMLGARTGRVFFTVTLPELAPAIAAACIPIFLYCLFSFMIVLLFGAPGTSTLEVELYQAARTSLDFRAASHIALIETGWAFVTVIVYSVVLRKSPADRGTEPEERERYDIGRAPYMTGAVVTAERIFFYAFILIITFFLLMPLAGIVAGSISGTGGVRTFLSLFSNKNFFKALRGTLITAPLTGLFCVITAFFTAAALKLHDPDGKHTLIRTLPLLPLAVSPVVMGYGMMRVSGSASVPLLIAAQTALFWPVAFRQIDESLLRIPHDTNDAAQLLSAGNADTICRIYLPYARTAIRSSFGFCLAMSAGDTTLPLIFPVPQFDTLALYTYRLAGSYRFAAACACGTILCAFCMAVFSVPSKINTRSRP